VHCRLKLNLSRFNLSSVPEQPIRAELRIQTICLSVLTVVAAGFALWWLRPVLIPLVVAAFLAFALRPLVDLLEVHARLPRTFAVCVALLLAVLVLVVVGLLTSTAVTQITSSASQYEDRLKALIEWCSNLAPLQWLGIKLDADSNPFSLIPESAVQTFLISATNAVLGVVKQSVIVLVFLFFLLLSSAKRDRPIGGAWGEMEDRIRAYIVTMTTLSAVTGVSVGVVLYIFGVQAAVLFGLLTFLLNFIPNVGSFISILLPIPIVFLSPNFTTAQAVMAITIPAAIQFAIGNFIQPKLMGNHMQLHPVVILSSLIFWGMLWGVVGAFLAVPITSIIRIACDRHPLTRPVADLMAGNLGALREEPIVATGVS
jgi:AI-2 transport protein TqsA